MTTFNDANVFLSDAIKAHPASELEKTISKAIGRLVDWKLKCRISSLNFDESVGNIEVHLTLSDSFLFPED